MILHQLFFYLTVLFLPTQLGSHTWPAWAFILGRRIDYLSPTLYLTDITIFLTLLLWICFPHKKFIFSKKTIVCMCVVIVFAVLNSLTSISPYTAFYQWLKVVEYGCFGYYIYKTKPNMQLVIVFLGLAALYTSSIAIIQFTIQHSIGGVFWFLGERTFDIATPGIARVNWCGFTQTSCVELLRPYATFPHPNVLGGFLATMLPFFVFQYKKHKLYYLTTIGITIVALILTCSRSAWLVGALGMLGSLFLLQKKKNWILLGICVVVLIGVFTRLPYFQSLTSKSESVSIRQDLARAAFTMWKTYPLIGVGLGNYLIHLPAELPTHDLFFLQPVHNIFLLLLAEMGIIGSGMIVTALYFFVKNTNVHSKYLIPVVLLLILGLVDHYPVTLQQGQLLLTLLLTTQFLKSS